MFVMTDDTKNCDAVSEHLQKTYREFAGAALVIHTKNNGEISEAATGKGQEELRKLRQESREIDSLENPNKVIVSVMMLREGWDVQNVTVIVGLRAYSSKANILPEQTLGRGLRRMFRGADVQEKVSVVGTRRSWNSSRASAMKASNSKSGRWASARPPSGRWSWKSSATTQTRTSTTRTSNCR